MQSTSEHNQRSNLRNIDSSGPWKGPLRAVKRAVVARAVTPLRAMFKPRGENAFGIFMYHRIAPVTRGVARPTWNVAPDRFRAQIGGLLARGYKAWPLRRVLEHNRTGETIPRNVFVVTFDDGYENNFTHAWPILRELNVPATIFLATAYLDDEKPFPSNDWSAAGSPDVPASSWKPMTTAQCAEILDDELIELGAHTHTHGNFADRPDDLHDDLEICCGVLKDRFGIEEPTFAFPYGSRCLGLSGPVLAAAARRAGVRCALTSDSELVIPGSDPYDWGRLTAESHDTAATLAVKLDGWYDAARHVWRKVRPPKPVRREQPKRQTVASASTQETM